MMPRIRLADLAAGCGTTVEGASFSGTIACKGFFGSKHFALLQDPTGMALLCCPAAVAADLGSRVVVAMKDVQRIIPGSAATAHLDCGAILPAQRQEMVDAENTPLSWPSAPLARGPLHFTGHYVAANAPATYTRHLASLLWCYSDDGSGFIVQLWGETPPQPKGTCTCVNAMVRQQHDVSTVNLEPASGSVVFWSDNSSPLPPTLSHLDRTCAVLTDAGQVQSLSEKVPVTLFMITVLTSNLTPYGKDGKQKQDVVFTFKDSRIVQRLTIWDGLMRVPAGVSEGIAFGVLSSKYHSNVTFTSSSSFCYFNLSGPRSGLSVLPSPGRSQSQDVSVFLDDEDEPAAPPLSLGRRTE